MIQLYLSQYSLLPAVPTRFTISDVNVSVDVSIKLQGEYIYTTTLLENNGVATFYGLHDIIRQNMRSRRLSMASFAVYAAHEDGMETLEDKYIIFAEVQDINDERDMLWERFLTTRSYYVMPRMYNLTFAFFSDNSEQFTAYADCVFKEEDGTIRTYTFNRTLYHYNYPKIYYVYLSGQEIQNVIERDEGGPVGTLLSYTFHVGPRSMTVYISDEPFEVDFNFYNSFNIMEQIFIHGSTKLKTSFDRKEATSQGVTTFYDMNTVRKYEVETTPLTLEEANWFNEFLESPYVERELNQDWLPTVLISDITSEISDSAKDLVKIKFSWRYDDNTQYIDTNRYPQVFSAPYNGAFK